MWVFATCSLLIAVWLMLAVWVLQRRRRQAQEQLDDALKLIATLKLEEHAPTINRLGGIMGLSPARMMQLVDQLLEHHWVVLQDDLLRFTDDGKQRAVHLLRAHRLLETKLVREAGLPLDEVHRHADRQEHRISKDQLDALNEHLGFPTVDPHGDPIPSPGTLLQAKSELSSLANWPVGVQAMVVHVEDEPSSALRKVLGMGVFPGKTLTILEHGQQQLSFEIDGQTHSMHNTLALSVQVRSAASQSDEITDQLPPNNMMIVQPLSSLTVGQSGRVVAISPRCQGFSRRRLLDLGMTPGTVIKAQFSNLGRSATAYKIRQTVIALREEQAQQILIQELSSLDKDQQEASLEHAI